MKPEVAEAMGTAEARLTEARAALAVGMPRIAAREAYLAALQAARGLIFESERKVTKTHDGTRSEVHRIYRDWPPISPEAVTVLADGFEQKSIADYGPLSGPKAITVDDAEKTLSLAALFIDQVNLALARISDSD